MALIAKDTGSGTDGGAPLQIPAKAYVATCVRVIDMGTQLVPVYKKPDETTEKHRIILTFELPTFRIKDKDGNEVPALISAEYTCSLHDNSTLYDHLKKWRGAPFTAEERTGFSLKKLLGAACTVQIENNAKGYPKVTGIMQLVEGTPRPPITHEMFFYEIEDGTGGHFSKIPRWQQDKILKSVEMLRNPQAQQLRETAGPASAAEPITQEEAESYNDPNHQNYVPNSELPF